MPECGNCGHFVTEQYVRVFLPDELDAVRCCPWCEDRIRAGGGIRKARSITRGGLDDAQRDERRQLASKQPRDGEVVPQITGADQ